MFLSDAEEAGYDVGLTFVEGEEEAGYLLVEAFVEEVGVGVVGESVGEGVDDEATILLGGTWGIGGDGAAGESEGVFDFAGIDVEYMLKLLGGWATVMLLLEVGYGLVNLVKG